MQSESIGHARFFQRSGPHRLVSIAKAASASLSLSHDLLFDGIAPLQTAGPRQVSFLDNRRYAPLLDDTRAGAVIVHPSMQARVPKSAVAIVTPEPYAGWARVAAMFHPARAVSPGIHPSAIVDPTALVDPSAEIGALCVIEAGAEIGPGAALVHPPS